MKYPDLSCGENGARSAAAETRLLEAFSPLTGVGI